MTRRRFVASNSGQDQDRFQDESVARNHGCAYPGCPLAGTFADTTMPITNVTTWYCRYHNDDDKRRDFLPEEMAELHRFARDYNRGRRPDKDGEWETGHERILRIGREMRDAKIQRAGSTNTFTPIADHLPKARS